jgi:hypothetical protein
MMLQIIGVSACVGGDHGGLYKRSIFTEQPSDFRDGTRVQFHFLGEFSKNLLQKEFAKQNLVAA